MKKYLYILGFAGVVLFTACSTSDDLVAENPIETPPAEQTKEQAIIVEASQDSEVPIILGTGQSRGYTRAPIDPTGVEDRYGYFKTEDGRYLGVFCLATGTQDGANVPTSLDQKWKNSVDNDMVVRLSNVPAKVAIDGNVTFMDPDDLSAVTPIETTKHYYYPVANWMKYNFYAYYPYDDGSTLSWGSNQVLVKYYEIDGSQDVIWGMSYRENPTHEASDADYADPYCAKYIRWRESHLDGKTIDYWYPKLKLNHKLVQFKFSIKKADGVTGTVKVTDMDISNAVHKIQLYVADKDENPTTTKNGKLDYSSTTGTLQTKSLRIKENGKVNSNRFDGTDAKALPLTTAAQEVGYIMLPSPDITGDPSFKYHLYLNFDYNGDHNMADIVMNDTFEEGKKYDITVNVKSPMEISLKAVLQEWDDSPAAITYDSDN